MEIDGIVGQLVVLAVAGRQAALAMITREDFGRTVGAVGRINRDDHREEPRRKRLPRNVVLVQPVTHCPGGLENQLVLEQTGRLAVERPDDLEQLRDRERPVRTPG